MGHSKLWVQVSKFWLSPADFHWELKVQCQRLCISKVGKLPCYSSQRHKFNKMKLGKFRISTKKGAQLKRKYKKSDELTKLKMTQ